MAKGRILGSLVAGLLLLGGVSRATADPTVPQMLNFCKPKQEGVVFSTPTSAEEKFCEVKANQGAGGWLLLDGKKRLLRRYIDSDGDGKIDTWSYFKDGVEVYRDIDTNKDNIPDQFRWLNTAGTKWGVAYNAKGTIDAWRIISPEETAQELFLAVQMRNFARLRPLFVTDAELQAQTAAGRRGPHPRYLSQGGKEIQRNDCQDDAVNPVRQFRSRGEAAPRHLFAGGRYRSRSGRVVLHRPRDSL